MKPGNLVKATRRTIGIPAGSIGLIIKSYLPRREAPLPIEHLARDLEIVS